MCNKGTYIAPVHKSLSKPCRTSWVDTIEHVHSKGDTNDQVNGEPDSHEVTRSVPRQQAGRLVDRSTEVRFGLTSAQASDREALDLEAEENKGSLKFCRVQQGDNAWCNTAVSMAPKLS